MRFQGENGVSKLVAYFQCYKKQKKNALAFQEESTSSVNGLLTQSEWKTTLRA